MPISLEPHNVPDPVLLIATGTIVLQDLLDAVATYRIGEWRLQPFLLDLSTAVLSMSSADIRTLAEVMGVESRKSPVGALAIVTTEESDFGLGRMFQTYSSMEGRSQVAVFRSREEAEKWLNALP